MISSACRYLTLLFVIYSTITYAQDAGSFYFTSDANIRSLEFYFYNSVDCSTGLQTGANLQVDNFLTATTNITANHPYHFESGSMFNIASNVLGATAAANVQCIQVYIDGGNANSNSSQCMTFESEDCSSGSSCTSTLTESSSWTPAGSSRWTTSQVCQSRNVYIGQNNPGTLNACTFNSSGTTLSCSAESQGVPNPVPTSASYTLGNSFFGGYVYFSTLKPAVYKCNYDPTKIPSQAISQCAQQSISSLAGPRSMAFSQGSVFITDSNGSTGRLISCGINALDGSFSSCSTISPSGLSLAVPIGIAINNDYLYIADFRNNKVSYCSMNGASVSSCTNISDSSLFSSSKQIAIYNGYAYIVNSSSPSSPSPSAVTMCNISTGSFTASDCKQALAFSGFNSPQSIAIYNDYAYITDLSSTTHVFVCTIGIDGTISSCNSTTANISAPTSINIF